MACQSSRKLNKSIVDHEEVFSSMIEWYVSRCSDPPTKRKRSWLGNEMFLTDECWMSIHRQWFLTIDEYRPSLQLLLLDCRMIVVDGLEQHNQH